MITRFIVAGKRLDVKRLKQRKIAKMGLTTKRWKLIKIVENKIKKEFPINIEKNKNAKYYC